MKLKHPAFQSALGLIGATAFGALRRTVDWKVQYFDPTVDTTHPAHAGRYVFALWHEYMLMPILLRGGRRLQALASEHGDGEIIARAMRHLGWKVLRGSSTRGGTAALLRMLRADGRSLSMTPDGPRGPRRTMSVGTIFLASRLGLPIVCMGYGYDRPWRAKSWDRFAVPRPFSRARTIFGPPLTVPPGLDRDGLERYRGWFERHLNRLTDGAEAWAESGRTRVGELTMLPGIAPYALTRPNPDPPELPADLAAAWAALPGRPAARAA